MSTKTIRTFLAVMRRDRQDLRRPTGGTGSGSVVASIASMQLIIAAGLVSDTLSRTDIGAHDAHPPDDDPKGFTYQEPVIGVPVK